LLRKPRWKPYASILNVLANTMMARNPSKWRLFRALLIVITFLLAGPILAQEKKDYPSNKQNSRPIENPITGSTKESAKAKTEPAQYSYEFSQPQFYIRHIVIEHDENGHGKISFARLNEETPIEELLEISPVALARIVALWESLRFLDSSTNYQSDKQFPHLGTMRIQMKQGTRNRTAEFNWTNNHDASALVNEYRRVADQAVFVFDISVARENQPLNTPKLMESLEWMLKRDGLSDPKQLIPLLKEISTDEHVPLITRNHAIRLLKTIEK